VVQDICKRQRFWWRRIAFTFQTVQGQGTYDLTTISTTPPITEILLDEITKFTLLMTTSPLQVTELLPAFTPESLIEMTANTTPTNPTNGNNNGAVGGRYTMDAGDYKTIRIDPPDAAYTAYIVGWAMPNPGGDSTNDNVPLIPPWGHNTIVTGIVAKVFRFAYGSSNMKSVDSAAEYEQGIQDLAQRKQFDPNYRTQLVTHESAIRST